MAPDDERPVAVPAPELREVAQTRWDVERDPVVSFTDDATCWHLRDPEGDDHIVLLRLSEPAADPVGIARALAETVASCDFPPTDDHASQPRIRAALRAAGLADVASRAVDPQANVDPA